MSSRRTIIAQFRPQLSLHACANSHVFTLVAIVLVDHSITSGELLVLADTLHRQEVLVFFFLPGLGTVENQLLTINVLHNRSSAY
jgi:hypothetical protein